MDEFVIHKAFVAAFEICRPYETLMGLMDDFTVEIAFAVILREIQMRLAVMYAALLLDAHLSWLMAEQA